MIKSSGFKSYFVKGLPGNRWPLHTTFFDSFSFGMFNPQSAFINTRVGIHSRSNSMGYYSEYYRRTPNAGRQNTRSRWW